MIPPFLYQNHNLIKMGVNCLCMMYKKCQICIIVYFSIYTYLCVIYTYIIKLIGFIYIKF